MKCPESTRKVAERIVKSWGMPRSNYIIVAPPLVPSNGLYKLLRDKEFWEQCGINENNLAVAYVSDTSYINSDTLVNRISESWGVTLAPEDGDDYLDRLYVATDRVSKSGRAPVVLLPKFHKAVEKLSWDLGTQMRNLEADFSLKTVVDLPVPFSALRDRWRVTPGKEAFICSDFGQGHSTEYLRGFTQTEAAGILRDYSVIPDLDNFIFSWTGGLPELLDWACREAQGVESEVALKPRLLRGASEQCSRFVKWLDAECEHTFKELIVVKYLELRVRNSITKLDDHDWKGILVDKNGGLKIRLLGHACHQEMATRNGSKYVRSIADMAQEERFQEALQFVENPPGPVSNDIWFKVWANVVRIEVLSAADDLVWKKVMRLANEAIGLVEKSGESGLELMKLALHDWVNFAKIMEKASRAEKNASDTRAIDYLAGRDGVEPQPVVAAKLLSLKIANAERMDVPSQKINSIFVLPEVVLQLYCAYQLKMSVWSAPKFDQKLLEDVNAFWPQKDYQLPKEGVRLSFNNMLNMGWAKMQSMPAEKRLFDTYDEVKELEPFYERCRNPRGHTITHTTNEEWIEYKETCVKLIRRFCGVVLPGVSCELEPLSRCLYKLKYSA